MVDQSCEIESIGEGDAVATEIETETGRSGDLDNPGSQLTMNESAHEKLHGQSGPGSS